MEQKGHVKDKDGKKPKVPKTPEFYLLPFRLFCCSVLSLSGCCHV